VVDQQNSSVVKPPTIIKATAVQRSMFDQLKSSFDDKLQINEDSVGLLNSNDAEVEPNLDSTLPLVDPESGNR